MPDLQSPGRLDPEIFAHRHEGTLTGLLVPAAVVTGLMGALFMLVG